MKMSKINRAILALALAFSLTVPAFAAGGETAPAPEEQPPVQTPEVPDEADPEPPTWLVPPVDEEQDAEPSETPDVSENPDGADQSETPGVPDTPETPETPSAPETPETPETPENPDTPETPPAPEDPVTPEAPGTPVPEDPTLPPAWLLPPEQVPVQTPEQVPPVVQVPDQTFQTEPPVIDVVVPNTGTVVINPYGLPVMIDGQETTEQVAGSTMLLENRSSVAVDVSVSAVGTPLGGVVFAAQPPAEDAPEKELFLYAEFQATEALGMTVPWTGAFLDASNQLMVTPFGPSRDHLMRLEAAGLPYSYGAARLFGSVSAYPAQPWEAGDGFHVNLAFTFTPVVPETPVFDAPGGTDVDSTLALPADPNVMPDWIIPSSPVAEPDPIVTPDTNITPDPVVTPETAVPPETIPETVPDESAAPVPNTP